MGKYIKLFDTHSQYNAYTADTANFILPNVSFCLDTPEEVHYTQVPIPEGYTLVEYIENNSKAYIDTGCIINFTETIKIKISVSDYRHQWGGVFGYYKDEESNCTRAIQGNSGPNVIYMYFDSKAKAGYTSASINGLNQINTYEMSQNGFIVNGSYAGLPSTLEGEDYVGSMLIFKFGTLDPVYGKLYYFSISGKRNMIPCINPNGVVGMYDTIGQQFYSSVNSDTFVAGPPI